jgi:single-stranded-DNA-specific exonuclease
MAKRWKIIPHDGKGIEELSQRANVSPLIAKILLARGVVDLNHIATFLEAKLDQLRDPESLPGLTQVADCLYAAVQQKKNIVIYGDYDADGMTSSAILLRCLKILGANVTYFVPNRFEEGYGLNSEALKTLKQRGKEVVVTVDCGIASVREAEVCREIGLELLITDHHQFGEQLPQCAAITHPALPGYDYPFPGLCGAGVAFKLAWALCQRQSGSRRVTPELKQFLLDAMGLAAIGTVADVVPLVDENRVLVKHGLRSLQQTKLIGLKALMRLAQLSEKPKLSSEDIGFSLAPRLNAAGRLGQAQLAIELLSTEDESRSEALADYIHQLNSTRETLERSIYLAAQKQIKEVYDAENDPAFVLAAPGWHPGVIGIVAGKLAEKYHKPVIVIALDQVGSKPGTGSARSAGIIDLHAALQECRELLVTCGGHAAAAGLKIEESNLAAFREAFIEQVMIQTGQGPLEGELVVDIEAPLVQLTLSMVEQLDLLAPFGQANSRPLLCATEVFLSAPPKYLGTGERHFAAHFQQQQVKFRAVAWGQGEWVEQLAQVQGPLDIVFRPSINEYNGFRSVELQLVDWRHSQPHQASNAGLRGPHFDSQSPKSSWAKQSAGDDSV